jgi:ABC-type glutathione transport system ATPase component
VILSAENLRIGYRTRHGTVRAVADASLTIDEHEAVGLVGESGSGKSSLARAMLGLLPRPLATIDGGRIEIAGRAMTHADERDWERLRGAPVAIVFQDPLSFLNPVMRVGRQIAEGVARHGGAQRVEELLALVRLPASCADAWPHELSGGMRQRVALAIALGCGPRLLIADEPTTALDVTTQAEILALLRELRARVGMALLLITHDLAVVAAMCARLRHVRRLRRGVGIDGAGFCPADASVHGGAPASRAAGAQCARALRCHRGRGGEPFGARRLPVRRALPLRAAALPRRNAAALRPGARSERPMLVAGVSPVLELRDISKTFRRSGGAVVQAVRSVSLTVGPRETVALVGESGSGKSTLARIALSLLAPDAGEVLLEGRRLTGMHPRALRTVRTRMQPVFQDPAASFNPRRTVQDALAQALRFVERRDRRDRRDRALALLDRVGLSPAATYLPRLPHELSGGQRQRLAIARALAMQPILIIADEPLSGVDMSIRGQILNLLIDLQEERQISYLLITHDISMARTFADRVAVMMQGAIVETGPSSEVLTAPRQPYTQRLIAAVPTLT